MKKSRPRGRSLCRFHDPSTFGAVAFLKASADILSNNESWEQSVHPLAREESSNHTCKTIAAWIQPLTGGIMLACSISIDASECSSLMSHRGVAILIPGLCVSWRNLFVSSEYAPVRDTKIIFFAPRSIIHLVIRRPRPPRPPAIM